VGRTAFVVRDPGDGGPDPVWFRRVTSGDSERAWIYYTQKRCGLPGAYCQVRVNLELRQRARTLNGRLAKTSMAHSLERKDNSLE
jgi:hypothetical protein